LCIQCGTEVARQKKPVWVVVGWSLAGLQCAVLCVGLFFFSEDKGFKQADVIPVEDHFSKVPARVIDEDDLRKELNEEEKAELKAMIALAHKEKWSQADDLLEASELESSFAKLLLESILNFHAERREDVMALSSSLPGHNGLQLLSSALRFSKAVDLSKSFEIEKAYLTLLPSLEASGTSGLQYFWAGTLAMNLQDLSSAEKYFEAALQAQSPVVQSHLFLGLLKEEGDKAASAAHFEALLEGVEDKPKVEKILKAYQEGV
jgi:tetratricopeptide (TPR) repeat protein